MRKLDTNDFIEKTKEIYNDIYDYSKTEYKGSKGKICVICPEHGEFWVRASNHLIGQGCPKCAINNRKIKQSFTQNQFIEKAKEIHGDKYDYSKVDYINNRTKVCIICHEHGEFWQLPNNHLQGNGCKKCAIKKISLNNFLTTNDFIEKAKIIHGDKYDYSKVVYKGSKKKVCIMCPKHGEFWQTMCGHVNNKQGCPKCANIENGNKHRKLNDVFVNDSKEIHNNKYDYRKVEYKNNYTKVCIVCPKHGEFWQTPKNHIKGQGCPKCNKSKLETEVENILIKNNINYIYQKSFKWLIHGRSRLNLDFYLPDYNISIECQGIQHFKPIKYFGGEKRYKIQKNNDMKKKLLCDNNNIGIIYYCDNKNYQKSYFSNLFCNENDLIKYIKDLNK